MTQRKDEINPDPSLPVFLDLKNGKASVGMQILAEQEIEHILQFQNLLRTQGIDFTETQIDKEVGKGMALVTKQGYKILFNPEDDLRLTSERLKTILKETIQDPSKLQYIDLRFGDHVYYK